MDEINATLEPMQEITAEIGEVATLSAEMDSVPTGGGTRDYNDLENKPAINGVELVGDLSLADIGAADDTEVVDIRIGADGTAYPTAGDAVRGQVTGLKQDLSEVDSRLSESIVENSTDISEKAWISEKVKEDGILVLSNIKFTNHSLDSNDGTPSIGENPARAVSEFISIPYKCTFNVSTSNLKTGVMAYYDKNKVFLGTTLPIEYSYIRFVVTKKDVIAPISVSEANAATTVTLKYENALKDEISSIKESNGLFIARHFEDTKSNIVIDFHDIKVGLIYKITTWNHHGLNNNNWYPNVYRFKQDGTYESMTAIAERTSYGSVFSIQALEDTAFIRLFANKIEDAETVSLDWSIHEVCGNRTDNIEKKIYDLENKKFDVRLLFNKTTAKIFKKVVCCGDSYTSGHIQLAGGSTDSTNEEFSWVKFMREETGNDWVNCGCSGCNVITWQQHDRGLTKAKSSGKAQAYVIGLMINDVSDTVRHVDLGTIADIGTEAQTYYGGMSKIIRELNAINPTAKIFVNTCPKTGASYTQYNNAVRDIVNSYKDIYPVHCIDLEAVKEYYTNTSLTSDYVNAHYTAIGYEQFAEIYMYVLSDYINNHIADFQNVYKIPYDE